MTPLPENVREGFFTQADVAKLVKHLPEDLHDFVWFAFLTGSRKGEIASLRWSDVDEEAKTLRLSWRKSKNSQARTMALAGELANIIKRCAVARAERVVAGHDLPYVFVRASAKVRNTRARGRQVDDFGWCGVGPKSHCLWCSPILASTLRKVSLAANCLTSYPGFVPS